MHHDYTRHSAARPETEWSRPYKLCCTGKSSKNELNYVLVPIEATNTYGWLLPYANLDSENAASSWAKWVIVLGGLTWIVFDRGPHLMASTIKHLVKDVEIEHYLWSAHSPWTIGTVKSFVKKCFERWKSCYGKRIWPRLNSLPSLKLHRPYTVQPYLKYLEEEDIWNETPGCVQWVYLLS